MKVQTIFGGAASVSFSGLSVAVSTAHVEAWLRILVLLLGGAGAGISAYWVHRLNKVKVEREQHELCRECKEGKTPTRCPIPTHDRPANCPLRRHQQHRK